MLLLNAFSLNMLSVFPSSVTFEEVEKPENLKELTSAIGHYDLANLLEVEYNRETVRLSPGEEFIVAQYIGPRLIEGTTELQEPKIKFFKGKVI